MTDQEIIIAIAEACGFVPYDDGKELFYPPGCKSHTIRLKDLPDYPNDLNAMHEAEKVLEIGHDGSQADDYQQTLYEMCNPGRCFIEDFCDGADVAFLHNLIHATARQRAEAFLRTKGLWK